MATQTLSTSVPAQVPADKSCTYQQRGDTPSSRTSNKTQSAIFMPPNEFRMKLLKRILSVDGTIDTKAFQKLQKSSTDKTLQANIVFENGDVGTLISFDRFSENTFNEKQEDERRDLNTLPPIPTASTTDTSDNSNEKKKRMRKLKLPPIMLQPVYRLEPRPLTFRDFSGPPELPPPPTDDDWEEMEDCRYLRPARKQFKPTKDERKSFLL